MVLRQHVAIARACKIGDVVLVHYAQRRSDMRSLPLLALLAAAPAFAGPRATPVDTPRYVAGETIIIRGTAPPAKMPKGKERYAKIAAPYSDEAIEHNVWAKAWLLLDIDEHGVVTRLKLLKKPGYDLDRIAIDRGFSMRFDPAEDVHGKPLRSQLITPIEWPSHEWLLTFEGMTTRIPETIAQVPCAGSGPLHLGSWRPGYRDCAPPPPIEKLDKSPWITRR